MYKIFIWGIGYLYNKYINCVRIQELTGNLVVQCVTSNEENICMVDGYRFIPKEEIGSIEYDCCVVAVRDFLAALREAPCIGIEPQKCVPIKVFSIPFFDLEKYFNVKQSGISIISRNCWAGLCYNYLGLPFTSPFINMFFSDGDFIKLMKNFDYYLTISLQFSGKAYDNNLKCEYPVGRLDDIYLYFNHYKNYEDAAECYYRRRQRINKRKLVFVSSTANKSVEKEFDSVNCGQKIIFVPYDSVLKSSIKIEYTDEERNNGITVGMKSNGIASGQNPLFDMLSFLNGEKNFLRVQGVR